MHVKSKKNKIFRLIIFLIITVYLTIISFHFGYLFNLILALANQGLKLNVIESLEVLFKVFSLPTKMHLEF